jgi:hypothetical protein
MEAVMFKKIGLLLLVSALILMILSVFSCKKSSDSTTSPSSSVNITGKWTGTYTLSDGTKTGLTFNITQSGDDFTGTLLYGTEVVGTVTGTVSGYDINNLVARDTTENCTLTLSGTATVSGDTMSFTFTMSDCHGNQATGQGKVVKGAATTPTDLTGNFLAWTGSSDASHSMTLVRINKQNGSVTNIGGNDFFTDLEYGPDGTLYGISSDLCIINPDNGTTTTVGEFHYQGEHNILMSGGAFSPDGKLYVQINGGDTVFTVNLSSGALTYVGVPTAIVGDIEFASNGTLYASFADLCILKPSDMSTISTVGTIGAYISSLTFGSGGTLYGIDIYPSTKLYSLSLTNGLGTQVTTLGSTGVRAIVAERAALAKGRFDVAASKNRITPQKSREELLRLEKLSRLSHQKMMEVER